MKDGGPSYPAGSEDMGGGRAGPDADGLGQMEMFEDEGGGGHGLRGTITPEVTTPPTPGKMLWVWVCIGFYPFVLQDVGCR